MLISPSLHKEPTVNTCRTRGIKMFIQNDFRCTELNICAEYLENEQKDFFIISNCFYLKLQNRKDALSKGRLSQGPSSHKHTVESLWSAELFFWSLQQYAGEREKASIKRELGSLFVPVKFACASRFFVTISKSLRINKTKKICKALVCLN